MSKFPQHVILNRLRELESGLEPDYQPVKIEHLASLDLGSASRALSALKDLETMAWAKAEYCLVRDLARILDGDAEFIDRCRFLPLAEYSPSLQTKAQALATIARIIQGEVQLNASSSAASFVVFNGT